MYCARYWLALGAVFAGLGVVMGSFGAHGLDKRFVEMYGEETYELSGLEVPLSWKRLEDFKSGARYQMYHAFGLIAVGLIAQHSRRKSLNVAGWCFSLGIVLFSGSLYLLSMTKLKAFGAVAPIGGTLMIVGWFALAYATWPAKSTEPSEETPVSA